MNTVDNFMASLPAERQEAFNRLRELFQNHLPTGFEERMTGKMLSYVVPFDRYPAGYHCPPKQPLPFISLASQKGGISLYHLGLYAKEELSEWFIAEHPRYVKTKLDMGKSCIRFRKPERIPYLLLEQLAEKMTVDEWISLYEESIKK
ncbi:MAG: DUF1801 domain-containing protein [Bacteroidota bacterium]